LFSSVDMRDAPFLRMFTQGKKSLPCTSVSSPSTKETM
jgi:hypothetical protein